MGGIWTHNIYRTREQQEQRIESQIKAYTMPFRIVKGKITLNGKGSLVTLSGAPPVEG